MGILWDLGNETISQSPYKNPVLHKFCISIIFMQVSFRNWCLSAQMWTKKLGHKNNFCNNLFFTVGTVSFQSNCTDFVYTFMYTIFKCFSMLIIVQIVNFSIEGIYFGLWVHWNRAVWKMFSNLKHIVVLKCFEENSRAFK